MAFIWRHDITGDSDEAQRLGNALLALRAGWRCAWSVARMRVFCAGDTHDTLRTHHLWGATGLLLGTLFKRTDDESERLSVELDERTSLLITRSCGELLIKECWGNYVAFIRDPLSTGVYLMKDPCGALPCYLTHQGALMIVFSCITDCLSIGLRFTADLNYVRERVVTAGRNRRHSSLHDVRLIHGGERLHFGDTVHDDHCAHLLWHPMQFANDTAQFEARSRARDALHATVRACTRTLATAHARVLHRLSGGLDSSIVLGCLQSNSSPTHVTAYTYFMPGSKADERPWARLAAAHARCAHRELPFPADAAHLETLLSIQPDVEPTSLLKFVLRAPLERALASNCGATAVFTGLGGDSGFGSDSSAHALVEYLRLHGPREQTLRIALHVARATQRSVWHVLLRSTAIWLRGDTHMQQLAAQGASQLITDEARRSILPLAQFPHPWCQGKQGASWAILRRLGALPFAPEFYDLSAAPTESAPEVISPLYAQPVVELCLQIPLYVHFADGRDRGLAREAFRTEVPSAILERTWKDRAPGYFEALLLANRDFLREVLLEGVLVKERLLKRDALERALSANELKSSVHAGEIFRHLDIELWLRKWDVDRSRRTHVTP